MNVVTSGRGEDRPVRPYPGAVPQLYELDRPGLEKVLAGEPAYRADQVWDGLYRQLLNPAEMTVLPAPLRATLSAEMTSALTEVSQRTSPDGDTAKWAWSLADGSAIETVLMHYGRRSTVCVSSQAGCAMRCGFCATGQAGFSRNLRSGEIVEQVVRAARLARPRRLSNVVFMGMGEPLANFEAVWASVERMHGAMGISARHITISTVGLVPGIRRLSGAGLPVNLAVSLHAANDALRDQLVPVNRRYPLEVLAQACAQYVRASGRRLSLEWALIEAVNDRSSDAVELAAFARPLRAHVNLIPLNPTPGYPMPGTSSAGVSEFARRLRRLGVNTTVRDTRGVDIDAACGQLAGSLGKSG